MKVSDYQIDILFPQNVNEASASSLKLCELFIDALLLSNMNTLEVVVDQTKRSVLCQDQKTRELIRLILGSGKLDAFAKQLTELLHSSTDRFAIGELRYRSNGLVKKFIFEKRGAGVVDWKIISEM